MCVVYELVCLLSWIVIVLYSSYCVCLCLIFFLFQAEDGIRDLVRSRGLGDVYKRQVIQFANNSSGATSYEWDFGDGTTSTLTNPTHTYLSLIHI